MPNGHAPPGLETEVDVELAALRGPQLDRAVGDNIARRGPMKAGTLAPGAAPPPAIDDAERTGPRPAPVRWQDLQKRHPEWLGPFWAECRALYAGGPRLLEDNKLMERLFPAHRYEDSQVYQERRKRAHYYSYPGTICEELLAGLSADPLRVTFGELDEHGDAEGDAWWSAFVADVTGEADEIPGEDDEENGCPIHHFVIEALREMLQTRHTWVLVDLPPAPAERPTSRLEEEELSVDPYLCLIPAEQVIDWEVDDADRLLWAMVLVERSIRATLADSRTVVRHSYTHWTETGWARYVVDVDPQKLPAADQLIEAVEWGPHDFKRVPLERFTLKEGMWAMGKLHSLAREHFNKRCAASWAEYKALFAVLYEFLGPEDGAVPVAEAQQDPDRAIAQVRGQGYTQTRGKDDRAEYIGPEVAPFQEARESCNDIMREMHRVLYSMAQSADMNKGALKRSGESKQQDKSMTETILAGLGMIARKMVRRTLGIVARGRGEPLPPVRVTGVEHFDSVGVDQAIEQAVEVFNGLPQASSTFAHLYLERLYAKLLGDSVTDEQRQKIREEIANFASPEELSQTVLPMAGAAAAAKVKAAAGGEPGEDDEEDDAPPPAKGKAAKPAPRKITARGQRKGTR